MAEKENNVFAGFEAMAGSISPFTKGGKNTVSETTNADDETTVKLVGDDSDLDFEDGIVDPTKITGEDSEEEEEDSQKQKQEQEEEDESSSDDDEQDNTEKKKKQDSKKDESEDEETKKEKEESEEESLAEYEQDIANFVRDKLFDKLGWELTEEDNFQTVDEIVDYLEKVVEENSTPQYANEELQQLDEYVRSGGDLRKFFDTAVGQIDLESIDLTSETDQKAIVAENLRNQGYKDEYIKKRLERYENAGILEDEAEEAVELVKTFREKEQEKLLIEQKKMQQDYEKQQQKFITDVQDSIESIKDVRGIPVSSTDKKKLLNYMFKVGADGLTQYQKDYNKDFTKNFIESAFLTMNGDSAFSRVEKKAKTDAAKALKQKLQQKAKRTKVADNDSPNNRTADFSSFERISSLIRKP